VTDNIAQELNELTNPLFNKKQQQKQVDQSPDSISKTPNFIRSDCNAYKITTDSPVSKPLSTPQQPVSSFMISLNQQPLSAKKQPNTESPKIQNQQLNSNEAQGSVQEMIEHFQQYGNKAKQQPSTPQANSTPTANISINPKQTNFSTTVLKQNTSNPVSSASGIG
jgi:hypothetical protein